MKRIYYRSLVSALCVIIIFVAIFFAHNKTTAFPPHDRVTSTLCALGVTDAKLSTPGNTPSLSGEGCLLYTSDSTRMGYYFNPDTGILEDIFDYDMLGGTYRKKAEASPALSPMQVSQSGKEEELIEFARACIGENLIGSLQLRVDQDRGELHQYTVFESFNGIKTGTNVVFTTNSEGRIKMCNVTIGSIFERAKDGTWVIAAGDDLIGEEAAIAAARKGLEELDLEIKSISDQASCELTAAEDRLIYVVRISYTTNNDLPQEYLAYVNAHTGELWQEGISR